MLIKDYFKETIRFVRSLVIKIDEIRKHQDYQIYFKTNQPIPDIRHSKYYQNISGIKNILDEDVYIKVANIDQEVKLTKETIRKYPYLKVELSKFNSTYINLVSRYPGMTDYIKGVIYDIDMETAITAENYSILAYDRSFIQDNELALIAEIETFIKNYMFRYHNKKYLLDELYLPLLLNNLYQSLVLYILYIKFKNMLTHKVDMFHMTSHIMSFKNLYTYSKIFDLPTNIGIYGNVNRLKHNIGKNYTLDILLKEVLDRNIYGVGKIDYKLKKPKLLEENYDDISKEYYKKDLTFVVDKANETVYNILTKEYDIEKLHIMMEKNELLPKIKKPNIEDYKKTLINSNINESSTKLFMLDQPEKIRLTYTSNFVMAFSNLMEHIKNKDIDFTIDIYNPYTYKIYKLTPKDIEYLLIKMLYIIFKIKKDKFTIRTNGIFKGVNDKDDILKRTWYKDKNSNIYDFILNDSDLFINIINLDTLKKHIQSVRNIEKKIWLALSNAIDLTWKNDIRIIGNSILKTNEFNYDIKTIDDYINTSYLKDYIVPTKEYELLEDLLEKLTGIEINSIKKVIDKFKTIITFWNKTTSYTIDLVMDMDFKDVFINNHNKNTQTLDYKSFLEIKDIDYRLLEEANYFIKGYGWREQQIDVVQNDHLFNLDSRSIQLTPIGLSTMDIELPYIKTKPKYISPFIKSKIDYVDVDGDNDVYKIINKDNNLDNNPVIPIKERILDNSTLFLTSDTGYVSVRPYTTRQNKPEDIKVPFDIKLTNEYKNNYILEGTGEILTRINDNDIEKTNGVSEKTHYLDKIKTTGNGGENINDNSDIVIVNKNNNVDDDIIPKSKTTATEDNKPYLYSETTEAYSDKYKTRGNNPTKNVANDSIKHNNENNNLNTLTLGNANTKVEREDINETNEDGYTKYRQNKYKSNNTNSETNADSNSKITQGDNSNNLDNNKVNKSKTSATDDNKPYLTSNDDNAYNKNYRTKNHNATTSSNNDDVKKSDNNDTSTTNVNNNQTTLEDEDIKNANGTGSNKSLLNTQKSNSNTDTTKDNDNIDSNNSDDKSNSVYKNDSVAVGDDDIYVDLVQAE